MKKTLDAKLLGGIFMIMGTSIGGGMLALPVAMAGPGFIDSTIFLILCWLVMTVGALLILEVNLWFPAGSNMISMARQTLGRPGAIIAWVAYLSLLYSLLCAYVAAGADISYGLLHLAGIPISMKVSALFFVTAFGYVVYSGIKSVDFATRGLIFVKLGLFVLLVLLAAPYVQPANLRLGEKQYITGPIILLITSFGFAAIVPSLRSYFNDNAKKLRIAIILGSLLPLVAYMIWNAVILGVLPRDGENGLMPLLSHPARNTAMADALQNVVGSQSVTQLFRIFASICILTSFLGVALSMMDFLADGLKLKKAGRSGVSLALLTFVPPAIVVIFNPAIFISALNYAGLFCVILLILLPVLMAWHGRYKHGFNAQQPQAYQVMGGRTTLLLAGLSSIGLMYLAL